MTFQMKAKVFAVLASAFAAAHAGFAAPINSCSDVGLPVGGYVTLSCTLSYNGTPNTFNLAPLLTQNGALLSANDFGANYTVLINGNPQTLADNSTGLFNQSLWEAVLYFPGGDPDGAGYSDMLDVYWPGSFPSASTVQAYNESLYSATNADADFFVQATGAQTIIGGGSDDVFTVNTAPLAVPAPEPASITLMGAGALGLGLILFRRRGLVAARSV